MNLVVNCGFWLLGHLGVVGLGDLETKGRRCNLETEIWELSKYMVPRAKGVDGIPGSEWSEFSSDAKILTTKMGGCCVWFS